MLSSKLNLVLSDENVLKPLVKFTIFFKRLFNCNKLINLYLLSKFFAVNVIILSIISRALAITIKYRLKVTFIDALGNSNLSDESPFPLSNDVLQ